ncbi:MAG: Fis family transcriptional regulator [Myxococcales bacterium]|nr:Fis family transcriptional regulator [Myxococcales bacterium]
MAYESPTVEIEGKPLGDLLPVERCRLEVLDGPEQGEARVFESPVVLIGSDPLCDLVLSDPTVSRRHCEIHARGGDARLVDLESTNGTFLRGIQVGELYLKGGSVFRAGRTHIKFSLETDWAPVPRDRTRYGDIIGVSRALRDVFAILDKVAPSELSVLIEGETGTGKELIARAIHEHSRRASRSLVIFDCSAFPGTLLESELFGHERGAFSGAVQSHRGVFERGDGSTIFLDEIGEMELGFQAKFLRALESGEMRRVGGERTVKVDARVVAATNRSLDAMIEEGTFRRDLFYRLAKVRFRLPPLRERVEDIPLLVDFFLDQLAASLPGPRPQVEPEVMEVLVQHDWPGNIRELRNVIERAATMCGDWITADYVSAQLGLGGGAAPAASGQVRDQEGVHAVLKAPIEDPSGAAMPLRAAKDQLVSDFERRYIEHLLEKHEQNISAAAREAQVDRRHFYRLLKKYGLMK